MERHFDEELKGLNSEILRMGSLTEEAIVDSVKALKEQSREMAANVINSDRKIDSLELEIEEKCLTLMALHQPAAVDLRFLTAAMKLNNELERIADLAVDIAQRVLEIVDKPLLKPLVDIPKLCVIAQTMVKESIDAFVNRDIALAKKVVLSDAEADKLRNFVQDELVSEYISKDASTATRAVPLLLIARHLERICDHATNIAEDVIYMVEAKVVKHHPEEL
ncbi:MAG: phosphate signaling complex protein PhoU [Candidatus Omnitrophica bacterium]|jgi:phosphate transport system protein|nr:phosphate signaling complex protein PhoU [Candidatus Omnitrophota bacterium]